MQLAGALRNAFLILALLASPGPLRAGETVIDGTLLRIFGDLYQRSGRGDGQQEAAAFIWKNGAGSYGCTLWPSTGSWRSEHWQGVVPEGTVAVAHTHPRNLERPSDRDVRESRRTGYPFYVITYWRIYLVDPVSAKVIVLIRDRDWSRAVRTDVSVESPCGGERREVIRRAETPSP